jgi:hypothetical protein
MFDLCHPGGSGLIFMHNLLFPDAALKFFAFFITSLYFNFCLLVVEA